MLVIDGSSTTGSASPSLLDSPTLARVERARLRHEGVDSPLRHAAWCQSQMNNNKTHEVTTLKRGLLWQQRDRLFSRWKQRYFILTRDYLHCFKRSSGSGNDKMISEMGQFIFKVKLVEVEKVEWINRKSYSTVALDVGREGRVLLRTGDGLEDWFEALEECMFASKERRRALRFSHDVGSGRRDASHNNNSVNSSLEEWLLARQKIAGFQHQQQLISDSVPDLQRRPRAASRGLPRERNSLLDDDDADDDADDQWLRRRTPSHEQRLRLSLLTDIDLNCDLQLDTPPPSVPSSYRGRPQSYRLNSDVFFMSPASMREGGDRSRYAGSTATPSFCSTRSVLTPVGSFRSTHMFNAQKNSVDRHSLLNDTVNSLQQIDRLRYRDRSQSDVHAKPERRHWTPRTGVVGNGVGNGVANGVGNGVGGDPLHRRGNNVNGFMVQATQV